MPSKPYDRTQPSLYLDTAVLSYAFNATHGPGAHDPKLQQAKPLCAFVEEAARKHNLCVSMVHMNEVARWEEEDAPGIAVDMAKWLDSLPLVWTRNVHHALHDEAEAAVERALGSTRYASPWASCFSAALESPLPIEKRMDFLRLANAPAAVVAFRSRPDDRDGDTLMRHATMLFHDNMRANEDGWSKDKKRKRTAEIRDAGVREVISQAAVRLKLQTRAGIADAVENIVRDFARAPFETLRIYAVQAAGIDDLCVKARGKQPLGDSHRSTLFDIVHAALGAAYADVFTCDGRTAPFVVRAREQLGMSRPLVNAPTAAFVDELAEATRAATAATSS